MRRIIISAYFILQSFGLFSQKSLEILIPSPKGTNAISPMIYGNFIEFLGSCINGGIYDEKSPLSDHRGFRKDVLEKVKELNIPILRFPGGTVTKIYHWEDGIGPLDKRKPKKNLIWGGIENNHFGTDEFIAYCREIGAEPCIVVNMATGTAEEAANWVEYCNGTGNTYYANLRRANGNEEPFNVRYWSLGNEEPAEPDIGRLSDPEKYAEEAFLFTKMMKLTDPSIKLFFNGDGGDMSWTKTVLDRVHPVCDYLSIHTYIRSAPGDELSLYKRISSFERSMSRFDSLLSSYPEKITSFNKWYRFPPRQVPVKIALDEWGIWENGCPGVYNLECDYNWKHALATATMLNALHRQSKAIEVANWAQLVNILGTMKADSKGSTRSTVHYPLAWFRKYIGKENLEFKTLKTDVIDGSGVECLDISASSDESKKIIILRVVNRDPSSDVILDTDLRGLKVSRCETIRLFAESELSSNLPGMPDIVKIEKAETSSFRKMNLRPSSIYIFSITYK